METYASENFPPKAGVYAVRAGPFIAKNIMSFLKNESMTKYVPQRQFLSLMMLGNGKCIGTKFGVTMVGKWVWGMKDYIDLSFMHLFDPKYLFQDGKAVEQSDFASQEQEKLNAIIEPLKEKVSTMDPRTAGELLSCDEETEEFHERWIII